MYVCIYIFMCMCVCVCVQRRVREREREKEREKKRGRKLTLKCFRCADNFFYKFNVRFTKQILDIYIFELTQPLQLNKQYVTQDQF